MPYSMSKAAKVAGVSKTTMHKWVKSGKMTATKLDDGTYSIDESELTRVTPVRSHWVMNHLRVEWNTVPLRLG